ncbi:hypothetical protein, partial [Mesorhizobium sp.]|uniref:hypothetical protein n=1 Tax=Mesorhizobium sp. TaxID=1871066 RepID=UPI0025FFE8A6
FTRPAGHNPRRKRTQNWIETGGNVRTANIGVSKSFKTEQKARRPGASGLLGQQNRATAL